MNKRLIELYNQAGEFAYGVCQANGRRGGAEDTVWNSLVVGRFAELIIQDSNQRANQYINDCGEVSCLPERILEEHFGVK